MAATEPVGWTWDCSLDRTPPHSPVPVAMTATEPIVWSWDCNLDRTPPCAPVPDTITVTEPVEWAQEVRIVAIHQISAVTRFSQLC
ncbi:hypothetical protein AVEN_231960-1 [Araneus ventricosus]|uniref:Uncharacterized protein n=1 Tax=Araneus ventricosus TaxID=182803 RepID=A0A4Y2BZY3_ARAVE|nr:hypothetical protein AVEN_231960-1 [Araneus ventricosus]